ncbi:MAG: universal stress protein [Wenzhouxiangella sp.]
MTQRILVGIDGSEQATRALRFALGLARSAGAELHLGAAIYGAEIELAEAQERALLIDTVSQRMTKALAGAEALAQAQKQVVRTHLLDGHPVEQLLALAARIEADHLVVGHRSKGMFERLLMGSVAKRVVDFARCSVTVVR